MRIFINGSSSYIGREFIKKYEGAYGFQKFSAQKKSIDDMDMNTIDAVLHCAILVHQTQGISYKQYYEVNVNYPLKLAHLAKKLAVKQFVFLSSVAVRGEGYQFLRENTLCKPVSNYGKNKYEAEKQLLALNDENFEMTGSEIYF